MVSITGETVMHKNQKWNVIKYLAWLPAIIVAAAIFYFSAQPANVSTEMSDGVTKLLLQATSLYQLKKPEQK